jgi:hypothetical protein
MLWGATALLLISCSKTTQTAPGTPVITMGNLNNSSDFNSYIVTVDSISLTRNDGNVFTPLVTPQTVDFATLNSMTELVEAPAVPSGTYTSATLTVDYSAAPYVHMNVNGLNTQLAPLNTSAVVPGAVGVIVTFDPAHPLVITQGQSVRLQIEFDLTASNTTTGAAAGNITVQPFAVIRPAPVDATAMRARGGFVVTQASASNFIMNLRPFFDLTSALGALTVNVNAQTYYNVNGEVLTGEAGLTALGQQLTGLPVVAYGTLDSLSGITPSFNATEVYAGTGQESQLAEYLTGVVGARSGNTLTLRSADFRTPVGATVYVDNLPVTIGGQTIVSQDGVATAGLTAASVSVGQRITLSGQATANSSGVPISVDATAGLLRLMPTQTWGTLNSATTGSASLNMMAFDGLTLANFNFAGTGVSGQDAVPADYQVNTGALDQSTVTPNTLLQVNGVVTPFGSAPPDFTASAITQGAATQQTLVVEWANGGSTAPFSQTSSAGLVVNLADPNLSIHHIRTGPIASGPGVLDLTSLPQSPLITTTGADPNNLDLAVGSATTATTGISVFNTATAFATGVTAHLNGTNKIFRLVAYGQYESGTNTFVASRIHVALHE